MGRESNKEQVRQLRVSEPQIRGLERERTMRVELDAKCSNWPLTVVAQYALRLALENQCTQIEVTDGKYRRQKYDVLRLLELSKQWHCGGALIKPTLKKVPQFLATMGHRSYGSIIDTTRPSFRVAQNFNAVSEGSQPQEVVHHGK